MQSFHPNLAKYRRMGYRIDLFSYLLWSESYLTLHQRIHANKIVQELEIPQEILLRPFPTENVILGIHNIMSAQVKIPSGQLCEEYVRDMNKILSLELNDLSGQSVKRRKEITAENKNKEESVTSSFVDSEKGSILVDTGNRKRRSSSSSAQAPSTSDYKTEVANSGIAYSGKQPEKSPTKKRRLSENDGPSMPFPAPIPINQLEVILAKEPETTQISEDNLKIHGGTANIRRH